MWRPFNEAREYVRTLKLRTSAEYGAWSAAGHRPADIPASPHRIYEEWGGWADWLDTGGPRPRRLSKAAHLMPFEEARAYVRGLELASQRAYFDWSKSGDRPSDIPSNPAQAYGESWAGWKDWLGLRLATLRPFEEARGYARSLNLASRKEWVELARLPDFPRDVPTYPDKFYPGRWLGWGDWLGKYQEWNHLSIASFLESLKPVVEELQEVDLYLILSRNGMLKRDLRLSNAALLRGLVGLRTAGDVDAVKARIVSSEGLGDGPGDQGGELEVYDVGDVELGRTSRLPTLQNLEQLRALDRIVELRITDDVEVVEFLIENRVAMLWQAFFEKPPRHTIEQLEAVEYGEFAGRARGRFLEEYREATALPLPSGYSFTCDGAPAEPSLMQRLTALRLLKRKRFGNWSGVGAGKTNAAILAAGVVDARLTVIVAANATLDGWKKAVLGMFPDARVHLKNPRTFSALPGARNFLVLNYESFQQEWTEGVVRDLTDGCEIDFLILDEVQLARQRTAGRESYRRVMIEDLAIRAAERNPGLRVLGMSATPVMNNLHEAKKTLELILGQELRDLPDSPNLANAVNVHMLMKRVGVREVPDEGPRVEVSTPFLDGMHLLERLQRIAPRDVLGLEREILGPKLDHLEATARPGMMIYTHFVTGIVERVEDSLSRRGLTYGVYTGAEKGGLEAFRRREVDVLIGSAPIGTGVDGLQKVCDRLVFLTLPWTHAEYEQIVGRIKRWRSNFERIEVCIPMVVLREDRAGMWSWDDLRRRCIEYKRTLADAALDGVVPLGPLTSKEEMQRRSIEALHSWIRRATGGTPSPEDRMDSDGRAAPPADPT